MLQWKSLFPTIGSQEEVVEVVVVVVVVVEEYYDATSLHCSCFSQLSIPFARVYLQPRIWWRCMVAIFLLFFRNQPTLSEKLVVYMMHVSTAMQKARGVGYFTYLLLLSLFSMELIIINFPVFPANVLTPDHDCTFEMQIQHWRYKHR